MINIILVVIEIRIMICYTFNVVKSYFFNTKLLRTYDQNVDNVLIWIKGQYFHQKFERTFYHNLLQQTNKLCAQKFMPKKIDIYMWKQHHTLY